jgi:hypothetical protein
LLPNRFALPLPPADDVAWFNISPIRLTETRGTSTGKADVRRTPLHHPIGFQDVRQMLIRTNVDMNRKTKFAFACLFLAMGGEQTWWKVGLACCQRYRKIGLQAETVLKSPRMSFSMFRLL